MEEVEQKRATGELLFLWLSVVLPPIVWAIQMEINYSLLRRACAAKSTVAMPMTTLAALAITVVTAVLAFVYSWPVAGVSTSARFVGALGLLSSAIFFAVILVQAVPVFMFHPCQL